MIDTHLAASRKLRSKPSTTWVSAMKLGTVGQSWIGFHRRIMALDKVIVPGSSRQVPGQLLLKPEMCLTWRGTSN